MHRDKVKKIERIRAALRKRLKCCDICPRNCRVDRLSGDTGYCRAGKDANVYTAFKHSGEEPGISHKSGSGTIFFSGCNLRCAYCQNHKFSHEISGKDLTISELAAVMLNLQKQGADNINLVTPTHYLPQILAALHNALEDGLIIPIVYNTSGYEKPEVIAMLEGIVDIYLSDMRYILPAIAGNYSQAKDYPQYCLAATQEMYRQKPKTKTGKNGALASALIIRHLVLPGNIENSKQVLRWIKENAANALVSVMSQYQPYHNAVVFPEIARRLSPQEYRQIKELTEQLDLNGWLQEFDADEKLAGTHFQKTLENLL